MLALHEKRKCEIHIGGLSRDTKLYNKGLSNCVHFQFPNTHRE